MKKLILLFFSAVYFTWINGQTFSSKEERLEWWKDARFGIEIKGIRFASGGKAKFSELNGSYVIEFDSKMLQPVNTIIELECSSNVMNVKPMDIIQQSMR